MATLEQRESGWWQAKIRRKGYPQESKTFRTKTEAEAWARSVETALDKGTYISASLAEKTTFADVVSRFKKEFAPFHYRIREDKKEAWRFQCKHLEDALGQYSVAALTPQVIANYRDNRLELVSGTTVQKEINMLSKILTVSSQEFGITMPMGNPVKNIRKPKENKSRDRRLSELEFSKLVAQCKASRNRWLLPALTLSVETAMRQGELLQLTWSMIDKKRRLALLLDPSKIKTEEPRAVPLSSAALAVIESLPRSLDGLLIPVERMTLYHAFRAACQRAGIEDYTWHDLRHEALSRLAERGDMSTIELASVSGHKTLQMLKRYAHLDAEKLAKKLG